MISHSSRARLTFAATLFIISLFLIQPASAGLLPGAFVHTGLSIPNAPDEFKDNWHPGTNLGAGALLPFIGPLNLRIEAGYHHFSFNDGNDRTPAGVGYTGYEVRDSEGSTAFSMLASAQLGIPTLSSWKPFGVLGIGYTHFQSGDYTLRLYRSGTYEDIPLGGISEDAFTWMIGAGFTQRLLPLIALWAEVDYLVAQTDDVGDGDATKFIPVKIGVKIGG